MKHLKFYTNEALCVVLHLSTKVEDFDVSNDLIYEKLEEYNIKESNILDFDIDLDSLIVNLYLQKDSNEIMFYENDYKNFCPELPIGSYLVLDSNMADALNGMDKQKGFNSGDEIEISGVSYDLSTQVVHYRLNTYVVLQDPVDILFDNKETSEENK